MKQLITVLFFTLLVSAGIQAELVKKSKSHICHDSYSRYYERTRNYTPYDNLEACLNSGGRLPKGTETAAAQVSYSKYQRSYFGSWIDENANCLNTRHELLMKLSTDTVDTGSNRCTVSRGRWLDPYTGQIFYEAKQLDIDHLVPLKWAWVHGADRWSKDKRVRFANDESNLLAVKAGVNRTKGALGPLQWLPPAQSFHCQYVVRFQRIMKVYGLQFSGSEKEQFKTLKNKVCR